MGRHVLVAAPVISPGRKAHNAEVVQDGEELIDAGVGKGGADGFSFPDG